MSARRSLSALLCFALLPSLVSAVDLSKLDRTIAKEPTYRTRPKYCLLVFGPEAKTRLWLVQDGDTLYVDRNGNGDLTEKGKKVAAEKSDGADEGEYSFRAGDVSDGKLLHKTLSVSVVRLEHLGVAEADDYVRSLLTKNRKALGYHVSIDIETPGWKGTGIGGRIHQHTFLVDVNGVLQFADKPQDAPIIHFGGRWQVTLFGLHTLTVGRETDIVLGVGTPGVGPGSTTYLDYENVIPTNVYPTVEISYPAKQPGEPPIRARYVLKKRC
jgi:hypothetical protein